MEITQMLLGAARLKEMGFSDEAIRQALSAREYRTADEAIEAVRAEQARIDAESEECFDAHLKRASATVAQWPEWKRNLLG